MKILVIYEMIPEKTQYCVLENPSDEHLRIIRASHNRFVNVHEWPEEEDCCRLFEGDCLLDLTNEPLTGPFDEVIVTGFVL